MVDWPVMRQILWIYGLPDALILVLRKPYSDIVLKLKDCDNNVRILSTVAVKQGENLAPIIFVFFIDAVGESILPDWERSGIKAPIIQYYNQYHPKEARHVHSPNTGVRQVEPLAFFKPYCVDNSGLLTLSRRNA